jgi:hypothetical protein
MSTRLLLATVTTLAALVSPAMGQDSAPAKPAMSASMPMDCKSMAQGGQASMPVGKDMHSGKDMPMQMGKDMPCAGEQAAKPVKPAKAKPVHDHAKFHKNQ